MSEGGAAARPRPPPEANKFGVMSLCGTFRRRLSRRRMSGWGWELITFRVAVLGYLIRVIIHVGGQWLRCWHLSWLNSPGIVINWVGGWTSQQEIRRVPLIYISQPRWRI